MKLKKYKEVLDPEVRDLVVKLGLPMVRTSFPGPEAHKLTLEEYAFEIGILHIGVELGFIETKEVKL